MPGSDEFFLPGVPADLVIAAFAAAPGNEVDSGKFQSPESSAALVANAFGRFLNEPEMLEPLPRTADLGWPATSVLLEQEVRFPWRGVLHPYLDVLVTTATSLIGIESKRYEPFRSKGSAGFSDAYWRPVWGPAMAGYERCRDMLASGGLQLNHLDATQLVKHAFGLRTAARRLNPIESIKPVLFYLFAEPVSWPDARGEIPPAVFAAHRAEVERFAELVDDNEVAFRHCSYSELLKEWQSSTVEPLRAHATAIGRRFTP